jgi:hypothetical protein
MEREIEKEEGRIMNDPKLDGPRPDSSKSDNPKSESSKPGNPGRQENRTPAMAGLAIAVVLLVVGLWLARELRTASKMQDCLMSGRTNCNVIETQ